MDLMTTKQEYIDALECITKEYYSTVRFPEECNKFNSYLRLFKGLVNEHFEEKQETNFEHYFEHLSKLNMGDFALINGRVTKCSVTQCSECDFNGDCIEGKFKWLKQPYEKPKYKLTKFEFDLIQTYRDCHESCKISEFKQLIELKDKGYFKCIDHDTKIQDVLKNCEVID